MPQINNQTFKSSVSMAAGAQTTQMTNKANSKNSKVTSKGQAAKLTRQGMKGNTFYQAGVNAAQGMREIVFLLTQFFDISSVTGESAGSINHRYLNLEQDFLGISDGSAKPVTRVERVELSVLPPTTIGSSMDTAMSVTQFAVPVKLGEDHYLAEQKSTVIKPDFNVQWTKIGSYNAAELFKDSRFEPLVSLGRLQELFSVAIVNPDTGAFLPDVSLQAMMTVRVSQAIPVSNSVESASSIDGDWLNLVSVPIPEDHFTLVEPLRITSEF